MTLIFFRRILTIFQHIILNKKMVNTRLTKTLLMAGLTKETSITQ